MDVETYEGFKVGDYVMSYKSPNGEDIVGKITRVDMDDSKKGRSICVISTSPYDTTKEQIIPSVNLIGIPARNIIEKDGFYQKRRETLVTRWFKEYADKHYDILLSVCNKTSDSMNHKFGMSTVNPEVYAIIFYEALIELIEINIGNSGIIETAIQKYRSHDRELLQSLGDFAENVYNRIYKKHQMDIRRPDIILPCFEEFFNNLEEQLIFSLNNNNDDEVKLKSVFNIFDFTITKHKKGPTLTIDNAIKDSLYNNNLQSRVNEAIDIAIKYGGSDESPNNAWIIDQMIRKLTGYRYEDLISKRSIGENNYTWDIKAIPIKGEKE